MWRRVLFVLAGCVVALCGIGLLTVRRRAHPGPWAGKCDLLAEATRAHADDCATDDDCAVTTFIDGDCCQTNCGPGEAHSRAFVEALRLHVSGYGQHRCPDMMCQITITEVVPRCEQKLCVGRQVPLFEWAGAQATACDRSPSPSPRAQVIFRDQRGTEIVATWSSDVPDVTFALRSTERSFGALTQSRVLVSLGAWLVHHAPAAAPGAAGSGDDAPSCSAYLSELASRLHVAAEPPVKGCGCPTGDPLCSCL